MKLTTQELAERVTILEAQILRTEKDQTTNPDTRAADLRSLRHALRRTRRLLAQRRENDRRSKS